MFMCAVHFSSKERENHFLFRVVHLLFTILNHIKVQGIEYLQVSLLCRAGAVEIDRFDEKVWPSGVPQHCFSMVSFVIE